MYVAREKIYPREVSGRFQSLRKLAVVVLLGIYYIGPWLRWDGRQAVLFDLPARQFHVFGLTFWPQDFFYLALLLIIAALSLFFFTALAGRLWCGFACPQTVWTEAFIWMERLVEGSRNQQMKLDRGPRNREWLMKKTTKHSLWLVFALWTGFTFVGYFTPIDVLADEVMAMSTGPWETFWILFYAFATWGNAGFLREQVCIYMCPYARFQSAMFDKDTLIIAYDEQRGEPRGGRKRNVDPKDVGLGDCIDCTLCVQVCPTGIDIRDGLQYECIACAACVDACDSVMDKMNYPRGLIRYATEHSIDNKQTRILRPRTLVYGALLTLLVSAWVLGIAMIKPLAMDVLRDRNALYRLRNATVENVYTLKIMNKSDSEQVYALSVDGLDELRIDSQASGIAVRRGEVLTAALRLSLDLPTDLRGGGHDVTLRLVDRDGNEIEETTRFFLPLESER
ncbi:MAG: cytochrome c oxidase accessory protein CcoG [Gammaproteobacteria bacterium]|nr:cytochrome c oxidase accessory protein CcoG [Gammaproteobacteria bacterium]